MKKLYKILFLSAVVFLSANNLFAQTDRETGIELYENGDYKAAAETLLKVTEADKTDKDAWLYLGMSFFKLKNYNQAVAAFEQGSKIIPKELGENEKDIKFISKPYANFTEAARDKKVQGIVRLAIYFDKSGKIKAIFAIKELPKGLTENAIDAAKKIVFEPATRDGQPISVIKIIEYSFTIF